VQLDKNRKDRFLEILLSSGVLRFGEFITKSGRQSPYFFNTGLFDSGARLDLVGQLYAESIHAFYGSSIDNLYGPAYKGIPLAVMTASHLTKLSGRDISFTFNRKETKDHGEGGLLVGRQYQGGEKVLIIEDVITGGTSFRETLSLLKKQPVTIVGIIVGIDRQERGTGTQSALDEIEDTTGIKTHSIISVSDIIERLHGRTVQGRIWIDDDCLKKIRSYQQKYGKGVSPPSVTS
jgi:orotate phosphoribosyltransferase